MGLDQFSEAIGEISSAATKELAIEEALKNIKDTWEAMELEISSYKDKGHYKLKWIYMSLGTCTYATILATVT